MIVAVASLVTAGICAWALSEARIYKRNSAALKQARRRD